MGAILGFRSSLSFFEPPRVFIFPSFFFFGPRQESFPRTPLHLSPKDNGPSRRSPRHFLTSPFSFLFSTMFFLSAAVPPHRAMTYFRLKRTDPLRYGSPPTVPPFFPPPLPPFYFGGGSFDRFAALGLGLFCPNTRSLLPPQGTVFFFVFAKTCLSHGFPLPRFGTPPFFLLPCLSLSPGAFPLKERRSLGIKRLFWFEVCPVFRFFFRGLSVFPFFLFYTCRFFGRENSNQQEERRSRCSIFFSPQVSR